MPPTWPTPPNACTASQLSDAPKGSYLTVAGLVILRQRPSTAKGIIFVTLEDETGFINVVVWQKIYKIYRRAIISARLLRITGKLQKHSGTIHIIAEKIEDISWLLSKLINYKKESI